MDTSKEYIKMCDCPEIQDEWKIKIGDNYWDDEEYQIVWHEGMESKEQIKGRIEAYKSDLEPKWLPRQDQIQEMIYENLARADAIVHDLNKWREENYDYQLQFITMEQFQLAFYIHEKHSKIWSSKEEKWIRKRN